MQSRPNTVLVVDDHDAFRLSVSRLLVAFGYDVIGEAADGSAAVAAFSELNPEIVLLDVQLPDFDGFEVAARIAALEGGTDAAIVLTSSRDRSDFGPLIERSPVRGFISKNELSEETLAELLG
jgi:DNA-binding NarL/FixJ family response regulator